MAAPKEAAITKTGSHHQGRWRRSWSWRWEHDWAHIIEHLSRAHTSCVWPILWKWQSKSRTDLNNSMEWKVSQFFLAQNHQNTIKNKIEYGLRFRPEQELVKTKKKGKWFSCRPEGWFSNSPFSTCHLTVGSWHFLCTLGNFHFDLCMWKFLAFGFWLLRLPNCCGLLRKCPYTWLLFLRNFC